jgi:hypothetical protein
MYCITLSYPLPYCHTITAGLPFVRFTIAWWIND